jgi:uncharacterized membrane protein/glutaredoxin
MRRQSPWIHRFSRPLIGAFAALGAADTGYLTAVKLSGNGAACSSESCNVVLTSPYANVFGQPLSMFGLLAYLGMIFLAIAPLVVDIKSNKKLHNQLQELTWPLILVGGAAMMVFSGYLMYLLVAVIKAPCPYCIASAVFSTAIFGLALFGKERDGLGEIVLPVVITAFLTLLVTLGIYSSVATAVDPTTPSSEEITSVGPVGNPVEGIGWTVTSKSGPSELALTAHLKTIGATMYGGWFCDHCYEQKQLLGREAVKTNLKYVECNERGKNAQVALCQKEGVTSFPTWDIKGKKYPGVQIPEKLAELSGYSGPKNFKYSKLFPSPSLLNLK